MKQREAAARFPDQRAWRSGRDALLADERVDLKKVSRESLTRIQQLLVINWRQKSTARSQLKPAIEDTLDSRLPPAYENALYGQKCAALFEHFYESCTEADASVNAMSA
jgi:type I restriction enzyme R subunit